MAADTTKAAISFFMLHSPFNIVDACAGVRSQPRSGWKNGSDVEASCPSEDTSAN
jgi:hypothetical protein